MERRLRDLGEVELKAEQEHQAGFGRVDGADAAVKGGPTVEVRRGAYVDWRGLLADMSLANLLLLRAWAGLPPYLSERLTYFLTAPPKVTQYVAVFSTMLFLGVGLYLLRIGIAKAGQAQMADLLRKLVFSILWVLALNSIRSVLAGESQYFQLAFWQNSLGMQGTWFIAGAAMAFLVLGIRYAAVTEKVIRAGLLVLSPLIVVQILAAAYTGRALGEQNWQGRPVAGGVAERRQAAERVVVLVFDEFDYRLAFAERPAGVRLPEFDALRKESFDATRAYPPGTGTLYSIPGLLSGKKANGVRVEGPDRMTIQAEGEGGDWADLSKTNFFRDVRADRFDAAVVGWFIPYCRLFSDSLTDCWWWPADYLFSSRAGGGFRAMVANDLRAIAEPRTFSVLWQPVYYEPALRTNFEIHKKALEAASDGRYDLVYAHLPTTHFPYFYDRASRSYTKSGSTYEGYTDSLELADDLLGELKQRLTRAGLDAKTTLVVTSDHSFRMARIRYGAADARVPFIVRFGGDRRARVSTKRLKTEVLFHLTQRILSGEIGNAAEFDAEAERQ